MRKEARQLSWAAAVAIAGALVAPSAAAAQEVNLIGELSDAAAQRRTKALCEAGDSARSVEPKVARRLYVRAINTGAEDAQCAVDGLQWLSDKAEARAAQAPTAVEKAEALLRNGFAEQADEVLSAHVAENPEPASDVPAALQPDNRALATAEELWSQGYETEAQEQVRAALAADPGNGDTVPSELQKAERKPLLARQAIGRIGAGLVTVAMALAIVVFALWLYRMVRQHSKRQIIIEAFDGGSDGAGAALQAEMQDRYYAWTKGASAVPMLTASAGTDQGMSMPTSLTEVIPAAGPLVEIVNSLDRFLPNRTWVLAGHFLPADTNQGVGLALRLYRKSNGKILDSDTLRQAEFQEWPVNTHDDDDTKHDVDAKKLAYQRLAIGGAAFFLYADRSYRKVCEEDYGSLGTKKWRSYAMANSAATYYPGNEKVARDLYRRALKHDSTYRDARFGMAVIDLDLAEGDATKLCHVERELMTVITGLDVSSGLWYRAMFWLMVSFLYRGQDLAAHAAAEVLFGETTHWWKPRSKLKPFLEEHRPNMLVIAAAALSRSGNARASNGLASRLRGVLAGLPWTGPVRGGHIVAAIEREPGRWPAAYNLAGYYAIVQPPPTKWIDASLRHLETALDADGLELARYAWRDWALRSLRDEAEPRFLALLEDAGFTPPGAGS